jgi:hypothetical protein
LAVKNKSTSSQVNQKTLFQRPKLVEKAMVTESYLDQNQNESLLQPKKGTAFFLHEQKAGQLAGSESGIGSQNHRNSSSLSATKTEVGNSVLVVDQKEVPVGSYPSTPQSSLLHPESPAPLTWSDKSSLVLGSARKSSGLRMWQGGQQVGVRRGGPAGRQQQPPSSAGSSRSPSPSSSRREEDAPPTSNLALRRPATTHVVNHATLPRASGGAASRLRGPASATSVTSHGSHTQRRSYGGGMNSLLPPSTNNRHASAPSTPRQSSMDLRDSSPSARASSPSGAVTSEIRRRSAHYPLRGAGESGGHHEEVLKGSPTRAVSERSLINHHSSAAIADSHGGALRYFGGSHQSLLPTLPGPEVTVTTSGIGSVSRISLMRPRGSTNSGIRSAASAQQLHNKQPQQPQPTVQISRSRVTPSHRGGFGFNQK